MDYTKTVWHNYTLPAINQTNLNKIETALYNADQQLDTLNNSLGNLKVPGIISGFAGSTVPSGWLLCNGQEVSKTTYSKLYNVIGDLWGTATDTTKFKLPNCQGRILFGQNINDTTSFASMGQVGGALGAWKHTHSASQGQHRHQNRYYSSDWCGSGSRNIMHRGSYGSVFTTGSATPAVTIAANGSTNNQLGVDIANMPPYAVCQYIICTGN